MDKNFTQLLQPAQKNTTPSSSQRKLLIGKLNCCVHANSDKKQSALVISRNFIDAAKEVLLYNTSGSFINRLHSDYINIQARVAPSLLCGLNNIPGT